MEGCCQFLRMSQPHSAELGAEAEPMCIKVAVGRTQTASMHLAAKSVLGTASTLQHEITTW